MGSAIRELFINVTRPLYRTITLLLKTTYHLLFFWLDIWMQRKNDQALQEDMERNLYFLVSKGRPVKKKRLQILPFDYSSACFSLENVYFCFTRGRGELNISLSPIGDTNDIHDLVIVIAVLDSKEVTEINPIEDLHKAAELLRSRMEAINDAFSERQYPEFRRKLVAAEESSKMVTRQIEWELNKRLSAVRRA